MIQVVLIPSHERKRDQRQAALPEPVTLRRAEVVDAAALEALAGRETKPLPAGPFVVAIRAGRIAAAMSLTSGELLADPFQPTTKICNLLRCSVA